jgi:hypothetical protein
MMMIRLWNTQYAIPAIDAQDEPEIPGVWAEPTGEPTSEPIVEPTGVEMDSDPQEINFDNGLRQQGNSIQAPPAVPLPEDPAPPAQGMAACNARVRKPPEKYVPSMKENKYAVAMTQIAASLKKSKHAMAMAQISVKLMSPGEHREADLVGIVMAQLSMKTAIKKWGEQAIFQYLKR